MGKFKKLQEDIENVTNKEVVKQTRCSDYCVNYFGGMCHRWYEF